MFPLSIDMARFVIIAIILLALVSRNSWSMAAPNSKNTKISLHDIGIIIKFDLAPQVKNTTEEVRVV